MSINEEIRKQRQSLKGQGFKAHWNYFWEYYKLHVIIGAGLIIFFSLLIRDIHNNKPYSFYTLLLNNTSSQDAKIWSQDFGEYAGLDLETTDCFFDTATTISLTGMDEFTLANQQKIMAVTAAGDIDVITADSDVFAYYITGSEFMDLREAYTDEELQQFEGRLYYVDLAVLRDLEAAGVGASVPESLAPQAATIESSDTLSNMFGQRQTFVTPDEFVLPDPSTMEDPAPVGIVMTDSAYLQQANAYIDRVPITGIVTNTSRLDTAKKYIEFLLEK